MSTFLDIAFYTIVVLLTTAGIISVLFFAAMLYVSLRIKSIKELDKQMAQNRLKYYLKPDKNYFKLTHQYKQ